MSYDTFELELRISRLESQVHVLAEEVRVIAGATGWLQSNVSRIETLEDAEEEMVYRLEKLERND